MTGTCVVDLDAVRANTERVRATAGAEVMSVVKADGYGHGAVPCALAALAGGATWLGVATLDEALALRAAGITAPVLALLTVTVDAPVAAAVAQGIDLPAGSPLEVALAVAAAQEVGRPARLHLELDTGMSRGGARPGGEWEDLVTAALKAQAGGEVQVVGAWSHLVEDDPHHPTTSAQAAAFLDGLATAGRLGLGPVLRHLGKSTSALARGDLGFDLVRCGLATYGLSPVDDRTAQQLGLRAAMTLRAPVALTKRVPAGTGVGYGHRHTTARATGLALVPLGYADGIPRAAADRAEVLLGGARRRIAGTVCMDQLVVEVGDDAVEVGEPVLLFGPGDQGEPTAQEWAQAAGTISYEIVTRVGARVPRCHVGTAGR